MKKNIIKRKDYNGINIEVVLIVFVWVLCIEQIVIPSTGEIYLSTTCNDVMYMSSSLSSSSIQDRQCNNMHTEESQTICETIRFSLHIHSSLQEKNNRSNSLLCHIKCEMRNAHACWRIHTWRHDAMLDEYKKKTNRKDINSMHI